VVSSPLGLSSLCQEIENIIQGARRKERRKRVREGGREEGKEGRKTEK
jgi:hypothetical protein